MSVKLKVLLAAATLLLGFASAVQAETVLRLSLQFPIKHPVGKNLESFKEEVERESKGDLKIEIYPSAQLYKDNEVSKAVGSGAIEMGSVSLTRLVGDAPSVDAFYVPFLFDSHEKITKALSPGSAIRAIIDPEIERAGSKVLFYQAIGGAIILSKGNKPIVMPEDMKGKLVRSFGATISDTIEALGGSPTIISGSEQFLAYQTGTVDAGMTGIVTISTRKLYEVMDHATLTNHADIEFIVIINSKVWASLSPENQAIITKAGQRVEKELRANVQQDEENARIELANKINIIELTEMQRAKWREATRSVVEGYIRRAGEAGRRVVEEVSKL